MKILFIIPPMSFSEKINLTAPYGILSMISYINKDNKHDVKIIDFNYILLNVKKDFKEVIINNIESNMIDFKPDYIGISALFDSNFSHLKYIVPAVRKFSKGKIIVGGGLATNMYKTLLKEIPQIDIICYGEGEIPLKKLLEGKHSQALITKDNINTIPKYEFIEDLDEIPIPDFNYIDYKKYNNRSPALIDTLNNEQDKVEMNVHTSRGCPFNCIFCSNSNIHGKKVRFMSVDKVRETIKYYIDNYDMNVLLIEDDNFLYKKERALEILNAIKDFNIKIEFPNGVAVYGVDDDISKAFYDAGVEVVPLAVESGSDHVLQIMQKPLRKEQIYRAVHSLKKFDIRVHAFVIIGIPGEFDEHRKETLDMLIDLEVDWVYIFIASPIVGSKLYEICEKEGYLSNKDYDKYHFHNCNIKAPGVDPEKIKDEAFYMNMVINYIRNSNYKNKNYDKCLSYFLNVAKRYPNNAVVHYMIYKTLNKNKFWNKMFKRLEDELWKI